MDAPLDPANANRYAYAGDDPINNLDPSGMSVLGVIISGITTVVITAAVGAAFGSLCIVSAVVGCIVAGLIGLAAGLYFGNLSESAIDGTPFVPVNSFTS